MWMTAKSNVKCQCLLRWCTHVGIVRINSNLQVNLFG